jgi:hypothetical protein
VKMLGLAGLTAAALMAFAGAGTASASGGVLCSTATNPCTSRWTVPQTLDWSLKAGTSVEFKETAPPNGESQILGTCTTLTSKGSLTSNPGGASNGATGSVTENTWGTAATPCTQKTVTTWLGKFRVTSDGDGNGRLIADEEIKWTEFLFGFITCEYGVKAGTTIGTIDEGKPATLTVNAVVANLNACFGGPETELWTATYLQTTPSATTLYVSTS